MSATPKTRRWTHALLVGQFALTLALLSGAGLTGKAFYKAYALDRNVQTSDAVTTVVRLPPQTYATPEQRVAFHQQLRDRLLAVPQITASAVASAAPFSPAGRRWLTAVDGRPTSDPPPDVVTLVVEPAYFHTVVRGLVLGESFSELHGTPGHEAAIVNQRFADVYLGAVMITLFTRAIYEDAASLPDECFLHPALFTDDLDRELEGHAVLWGPEIVSGAFGTRRIAFVEAPGGIRLEFMEQLEAPAT